MIFIYVFGKEAYEVKIDVLAKIIDDSEYDRETKELSSGDKIYLLSCNCTATNTRGEEKVCIKIELSHEEPAEKGIALERIIKNKFKPKIKQGVELEIMIFHA